MAVPLLDADQLRTLVAIADTGSFTRAAEDVNKTQAAVSMQMRRLEDIVGRKLFSKNGRQNQLTGDGEHLLEYARRIITLNNEAMTVLCEPELAGHVRIGTPDDYAERFLPGIFARFARTHPLVEVEILCQGSHVLLELVNRGDLDLAIATHSDCGAHGEVIRREKLCWVGSPRHRLEHREILPIATGEVTCSWRYAATKALDEINRPYRVLYSSPSATAIVAAVMSGLAVTVLPESAVRSGMRRLGDDEGYPELPYCDIALLRSAGGASSSVDALATHVEESLSNLDFAAQPWM
ncbi:MAG: LysR substrate-binding domain-containing protein [Hyphomicrobiaceae bacterium]|nr:LysR substrate-binding domain-containing protein [Hyphomicrobiaceae bacterium]